MDFLSKITGFFSGGWMSYALIGLLCAVPTGIAIYKIKDLVDNQALSIVQHNYDVANGQNAVLVAQINSSNARIAKDKADSDARVKQAQKDQAVAEARAAALIARGNKVLEYKPGKDLDVAIAQVALKGIE